MMFSVQNFNINIISIECNEGISAIAKEVETFPATFDFSIAFKSKDLDIYVRFSHRLNDNRFP